jgi:hypothetical protein
VVRKRLDAGSEDDKTLAQGRWLAENDRQEREIELKTREQDRLDKELGFKFTQSKWFTQPLALAVFAAAVAGGANVGVSWLNNEGQLQVERVRDEASRIVSAISTNDPDRAATNLKFLLDVGLLHDEQPSRD